jgi:hypothetical protein
MSINNGCTGYDYTMERQFILLMDIGYFQPRGSIDGTKAIWTIIHAI